MIFGMMKMNEIIKIALSIAISFIAATNIYAGDTEAKAFKEVLAKLASVKQSYSGFTETKKISLLDNEIKLSGLLEYAAPDSLVKQTLKPAPELFKITGNNLHLKNAAGEETDLLLTNYPIVEMFVEAYRGILSGHLEKLTGFYKVNFKGDVKHWFISLTPIEDEALEYIEMITVEGQGATIRKFITVESNGDKSIMLITNK